MTENNDGIFELIQVVRYQYETDEINRLVDSSYYYSTSKSELLRICKERNDNGIIIMNEIIKLVVKQSIDDGSAALPFCRGYCLFIKGGFEWSK